MASASATATKRTGSEAELPGPEGEGPAKAARTGSDDTAVTSLDTSSTDDLGTTCEVTADGWTTYTFAPTHLADFTFEVPALKARVHMHQAIIYAACNPEGKPYKERCEAGVTSKFEDALYDDLLGRDTAPGHKHRTLRLADDAEPGFQNAENVMRFCRSLRPERKLTTLRGVIIAAYFNCQAQMEFFKKHSAGKVFLTYHKGTPLTAPAREAIDWDQFARAAPLLGDAGVALAKNLADAFLTPPGSTTYFPTTYFHANRFPFPRADRLAVLRAHPKLAALLAPHFLDKQLPQF